MSEYLENLRNTFSIKALDFEFGLDDPHYKELQSFYNEQMALLREMPTGTKRPQGMPSDTYLHSMRVAEDVHTFTRFIGLSNNIAMNMRWAVALHDIGKMDVPTDILEKPDLLSDEEFAEMKRHTTYGVERIKKLNLPDHPLVKLALDIAKYHHERHDGKGYYGLSGNDIPSRVRLVQLCDIYDAVSAPRIYRSAKEQLSPYDTMKNMLDPNGFLYGTVDQRFVVPFCLLKVNLLEADLTRDVHKTLEPYLLYDKKFLDHDFWPPSDVIPDLD